MNRITEWLRRQAESIRRTKEVRFTTHGSQPRLMKYRRGWELTDYSHVVYKTTDSCVITNVKMN